jgi:2,3-diaminopropionate biosynthesis protein SbnA
MTIIAAPEDFNAEQVFVDLQGVFDRRLFLKCEGFNFGGSIKMKAATEMVRAAERDGVLTPGSVIVESSSGNLGVALSVLAASRGYEFICVTDVRCNRVTRQMMESLGTRVHVLTQPHPEDGLLGARLRHVRQLVDSNPRYVWLNQYANPANATAHFRHTAPAIAAEFPELDVLFVGAGTTGTLMGCARFFRQWHRPVAVVAVDAVGSVALGGTPGRRLIPGLGSGVRPPLLDESLVDGLIRVPELNTARVCRTLARRGFLFGGSTGTVVAGALAWLDRHEEPVTAVAVAPDLGDRYLDSVFDAKWLLDHYGPAALDPDMPAEPVQIDELVTPRLR